MPAAPADFSHPADGAPPALALRLGYAGLVPFVLGAALTWAVRPDAHPYVVDALLKYAAVIVSFLGGIHWGLGMKPGGPSAAPPAGFVWGIAASLGAWVAVVMPAYAGLALQGALLLACYAFDRGAYRAADAAGWLTLRFRLTAVASLSCFIAAAGS